jgi:hypothetical protein
MKTILIIISLILPALSWGEEIRPRYITDVAPAGSLVNPYVIVDDHGQEIRQLRPRYPVSLDPGNPDYEPGGRYNPLEIDD